MKIKTTARHYELTPALKDYAERKVYRLKKYFDHIVNARITFSLEKYRQAVEVTVHINGKDFISREESEDMYASVDGAIDKLERQILKFKGKKMKRKSLPKFSEIGYAFPDGEKKVKGSEEMPSEVSPAKREEFPLLTIKEALQEMRGNGRDFSIFSNPETNKLNIIYKRVDGTLGLIEV